MEAPTLWLYLSVILSLGVNWSICRLFWRRLHDQILLGLVSIHYAFQSLWLLLFLLIGGQPGLESGGSVLVNLNDSPLTVFWVLSLMPVIAGGVGMLLTSKVTARASVMSLTSSYHNSFFERMLCLFAFGSFAYYVSIKYMNWYIGKAVMAYIHYSFSLTPVLIGFYWKKCKVPFFLFLGFTFVTAAFALAEGSRSLLFFPFIYCAVGIYFTMNRKVRNLALICAALGCLAVFYFSALIESVRRDVRIEYDAPVVERLKNVIRFSVENARTADPRQAIATGMGRMVTWSALAVAVNSPSAIPYRGLGDLWDEFRYLNRLDIFTEAEISVDEAVKKNYGLGVASMYGFGVTEGSTVPFPIIADGWSRLGIIGVIIFGGTLCIMWGTIERMLRRRFSNRSDLMLGIIAILASSALERMSVFGFVYNLRYLIMLTALWGMIFYWIWLQGKSTLGPPNYIGAKTRQ